MMSAFPEDSRASLVVGGRIGLWEEYLLQWLPLMQSAHPEISIRAESALEPELMQGLVEGRIDIGVMYTPQSRPGLKVEQLFEEQLILVSTDPRSAPEPQPGYVYVDWGPEFYARHSAIFPNFAGPSLTANIGWLGLQHVLQNGGSGYFARRIVEPLLKTRRLHVVTALRNSRCRPTSRIRSTARPIMSRARSRSCIALPTPKRSRLRTRRRQSAARASRADRVPHAPDGLPLAATMVAT